jgi:hypothetical protein
MVTINQQARGGAGLVQRSPWPLRAAGRCYYRPVRPVCQPVYSSLLRGSGQRFPPLAIPSPALLPLLVSPGLVQRSPWPLPAAGRCYYLRQYTREVTIVLTLFVLYFSYSYAHHGFHIFITGEVDIDRESSGTAVQHTKPVK